MNLKTKIYLLFLFCFVINGFSQSKDFIKKSNQLFETHQKKYDSIHASLKEVVKDSINLNYLYKESKIKKQDPVYVYSLINLGVNARDKSDYKKALKYHFEASKIAEKFDDKLFLISNLNMLGVVFRRTDSLQFAINCHQKALELAEKINPKTENVNRNIAISLNSLGNIYLALDQFNMALDMFSKSLQIEIGIGNKLGLAINYQNIGYIYERKNNFDLALKNYNISLNYNKEINSDIGKLICYNSIGEIYLKQKNTEEASKYISPTIEMANKIQDDFYTTISYINSGWLSLEQNKNTVAQNLLFKAKEIAEEKKYKLLLSDIYDLLYKVEYKNKNFEKAIYFLKRHHETKDEIINEKNLKYITEINSRLESKSKKSALNLLKKENELVKLKLKNNRTSFLLIGLLSFFLIFISYIYYRQKDLKSEKKLLQVEQKMLRVQMNPHFIFNSLNSIKSYIIKSDKENAVHYLNKFSKLIQVILSGSNDREVTLKEELEIIDVYASIENIRFSEKISFSIDIAKNVDTDNIKIPSLLLQPFVENSIWHGLSLKENDKKINISISTNENKLNIIIEDNGIGRENSQSFKAKKLLNKESLGIKVTNDRLKNYYGSNYELQFIDLMDEKENPNGTKVILQLPLN